MHSNVILDFYTSSTGKGFPGRTIGVVFGTTGIEITRDFVDLLLY